MDEASRARVALPTASGSIEILEASGSHQCSGCGRRGGGMVELHVDRGPAEQRECIPLCGNCVSSAVAVHLRRRRGLPARPGPVPE